MSDILDIIEDLEEEDFTENFSEEEEYATKEIELASKYLDDYEMDEIEAKEITEAIRSAATATYILLSHAHEKKAHKALGYSSWSDYVRTEFEMSSQRSYQLIDLSKVVHEIESSTPEGTRIKLTEAQARDIKRELPRITERIAEETDGKSPSEAADAVNRIVEEIRDQKRADEEALRLKQAKLDEEEDERRRAELEKAADRILEADQPDVMTSSADGEFIEIEVEGDDGHNLSPQDSMNLYNFFNAITSISSLPEPDDFIRVIPESRVDEVDNQVLEAVAWLNRFQTLWEIRKS